MSGSLTVAEVARELRHSVQWFYRQRAALEAKGFPKPVDGCGNRYSAKAVQDWIDRDNRPRTDVDVKVIDVAELLDNRARAIAERLT